ncbi:pirin family protein [Streptomyces andamanensis]|uniref:Pirin family protein n=1 Tax=Streptomyces andamanensis TaxID=1565035 RepID=A0ABV8TN95_9ACTN
MSTDVRRAADRYPGGDESAGISTRHAFSFGPHYDPDNLGHGALIACNEEHLAPGAGFAEHPHSHTEIVTWVVEGELTHRDSTGRRTVIRPGDLQHLSAAAGVRHTERNDADVPLTFVQMWLTPPHPGGEPRYEAVRALPADTPYPVPGAGATLRVLRLRAGGRTLLPSAPHVYVHVVRGELRLSGHLLAPGDAARLTDPAGAEREAVAVGAAEVLVWELRGRQAREPLTRPGVPPAPRP